MPDITPVITSVVWEATNLPNGLSISEATGIITGTPTTPGQYTTGLKVTTNYGEANGTILITVLAPDSWKPTIADGQTLTLTAGEEMTPYIVLGTNVTLSALQAPAFSPTGDDDATNPIGIAVDTYGGETVTLGSGTGGMVSALHLVNTEGAVWTLTNADSSTYPNATTTVPSWASIDSETGVITLNIPEHDTLAAGAPYGFKVAVTNRAGSYSTLVAIRTDNNLSGSSAMVDYGTVSYTESLLV